MPGVTEILSDEEACLVAILTDPSGLDLAEFCWYDPVDEEDGVNDGCWRARPYQWTWWRDMSPLQIDQCARDIGKSLGIQARAYAFPYAHPGAEMVVTAPELIHLEPVTTAIEQRQFSNRLGVEMMPRARSRLTRRPFRMNFITGSKIVGRIPQVTGRGVKGLHPVALEADEMQDFPEAGWTELIATLRRGIKGAIWRAHGVTRGVRDKFWEFTQPSDDNPWKVHRITAMHRPDWSDAERQLNIQLYGSRESPDYRRNILGLHGDQTNVLFVLHRLMRIVDSVEASTYNSEEYQYFRITAEMLEDLAGVGSSAEEQARSAEQLLVFSETHERYGPHFWVGQDVGFTADPSEILIAAEYIPSAAEIRADKAAHRTPPEKGVTRLRVLCRIHLERISNPIQVAIILHVIAHYQPKAYGIDKTGNGLGLFQDVQATDPEVAKVIRGYNFSENVIVGIDGTVTVTDQDDLLKEAALKSNVLEYSTDKLRDLVDVSRWFMPWDRDMLQQFQGQTWSYSKTLSTKDERRKRRVFSAGHYHVLDAARMLAMAHAQAPIEEMVQNLRHPVYDDVVDVFIS